LNSKTINVKELIGIELGDDIEFIYIESPKPTDFSYIFPSILNQIKMQQQPPQCLINHTEEERLSYIQFDEDFATRPKGSDGTSNVADWDRKKIYQTIKLNYLEKDSYLAGLMFDSDVLLKQMVLGKKRLRVSKAKSFYTYLFNNYYSSLDTNGNFPLGRIETAFVLFADTIIYNKDMNKYYVDTVVFKIKPINNDSIPNSNLKVAKEWANNFNTYLSAIIRKNELLQSLDKSFKAYFLLHYFCKDKIIINVPAKVNFNKVIPDSIKAIKAYEQFVFPAPLFEMPGRFRFTWLMISGAISFNYDNATIIRR
jgi:hypothetical protein